MLRLTARVLVVLLTACSTTAAVEGTPIDTMPLPAGEFSYAGGDGTTIENAVIVVAQSAKVGVPAEYAWISKHFPGSTTTGKGLVPKDGRWYDAIDVITKEGERRTFYFDISSFFGKF